MSEEHTPHQHRLVLMDADLFDELVESMAEKDGKDYTVEYGGAFTRTVTFFQPTIYENDPHPDPLTVGVED